MATKLSVRDYLRGPEEMARQELVWGVVMREPPAPFCNHQGVVTRAVVLLASHASRHGLGQVLVSPVDVVLDEDQALVLQPDVVFVSIKRLAIIRDRIWGAPDLVVEVLSPGTRRRDSISKRRWYRQYGVREYWIVDPASRCVTVITFDAERRARPRSFSGRRRVVSGVLAGFDTPAASFFD
jgi:Uma2 family endonuclease